MDGEFVCEDYFGTITGVAGGNLLIGGTSGPATLRATEAAVTAIKKWKYEPLAYQTKAKLVFHFAP